MTRALLLCLLHDATGMPWNIHMRHMHALKMHYKCDSVKYVCDGRLIKELSVKALLLALLLHLRHRFVDFFAQLQQRRRFGTAFQSEAQRLSSLQTTATAQSRARQVEVAPSGQP